MTTQLAEPRRSPLTAAERHRVLVEWNDTRADYSTDTCIHHLFEEQATQAPDAPALLHGDRALPYGELNRRANQLAHHLRRRGVGPEVLVGVCVERSLEMIVALLGVLKAGGAYVPLDPAYPKDRLAFMLEDAGCPLLLTQQRLAAGLPSAAAQVLSLDADGATIEQEPDVNPEPAARADHCCYVIYTSGSTGRPKGVVVTHRTLVHSTRARMLFYPTPPARYLLLSSFAFDSSVAGIYGTLCRGGALCIPDEAHYKDTGYLARLIAARQITDLLCIPSLYLHLLGTEAEQLQSLKTVMLGGEAVPPNLVAQHYQLLPRTTLVNEYGPTEATVWCTAYDCRWAAPGAPVPIGRPIANTALYILDETLEPLPPGAAGELFVGGWGVTRGYLNRPELTAERFLTDPFRDEKGARMYRTGDLGRFLPDGNIEFLGRVDHQVKIRGYRIELGEIEAELTQHPAVHEAAVLAREDVPGNKRLVAYVVPRAGTTPTPQELRGFLRERLPDYEVPAAVVLLDAFPLTPNGKLDRKALPPPGHASPGETVYVPPQNRTEEALADIWAEVLGVERVGAQDDFFALGGHSLKATQALSRIRQRLGVELPLQALFDSPTVADLSEVIQTLASDGRPQAPPLVRRAGARTRFPASFAQERLWFLDQFIDTREVYNVHNVVRLRGPLDVEVLRCCLGALAARHESLRTSFTSEDGRLFQVLHPPLPVDLPIVDLGWLRPSDREGEARLRAAAEVKRTFDLAQLPLWRALLLRLTSEDHFLVLVMHHVITDGWSMPVFFRELAALYDAEVRGADAALPPVLQYADFSQWQRDWLQGAALAEQLAYWKEQLAPPLPTLHLPVAKPRPRVQTFPGAVHVFDLPPTLVQAVDQLSQAEGGTRFMTLLAAFAALLHRYAGQDDLLIGTPIANRNRAEVEGIVGFFVNSLAIRADLAGDPTFRELLGRIRRATLGAFAHQDVPFEKLVEELRPERDTSRHPLFQVMFVLQNMPALPEQVGGLSMTSEMVHNDTAMFDLTLILEEKPGGLWGWFEYNTDLFDAETIRALQEHYLVLLEGAVTDARSHVSRLPLLTAAERQRIVHDWNATRTDYPHQHCIHQLVEEQVARTPDAVAVLFAGEALTYRELNERANRLAHHLRDLGVGPGVLVGVCLRRSADMLSAVLGVLKAGGAYVPLDPAYPKDRLAFMLEDTQAPVLLTQEALLDRLPETSARVLCLDQLAETLAACSPATVDSGTDPDSLAYIIYTSGSTGRPKGVVLRHGPVVNLIDWVNRTFHVGPGDQLLFVTSLNFDLSVYDIFGTLAAGASVRVASGEELKDPERLLQILWQEPITFWDSAPPQLQQLVPFFPFVPEAARTSHRLRLVFLSGDWIPVPMPDQIRQTFPGAQVVSLGGATEAAIWSNYYPIGAVDPAWPSIPYGKPIQNARYHVLDAHLQPVPVGVPAELHIGGLCLAEGYLNRAELTAERFIPDPFHETEPFAAGPGQAATRRPRLYKTGDLARYFADGNLEFLGRMDHQVKIRGFRIELGEIEAVLAQHPAVANSVVLARKDAAGDRYLVGYVVPRAGQTPEPSELRRFLQERLPDYMVPPYLVRLETFPLSPNGKIDRKALPEPDRSGSSQPQSHEPPRDAVEEALASIWTEVLGVSRVGVQDDFFALGGHSLKATQVMSRIRRYFPEIDIPLRTLFEAPTMGQLANTIRAKQPTSRDGQPPPLLPLPRQWLPAAPERPLAGARFPASFTQRRLWFLDQLEQDKRVYNVPLAVRIQGPLRADALQQALQALVDRHEALRTSFASEQGEPMQIIAPSAAVTLPVVDLVHLPPAERAAAVRAEKDAEGRYAFDLARGPLWRVKLLRLAPDEHLLLVVLHHIITDHWSLMVLFGDLSRLYEAAVTGRPADLPALPVQYADFSEWQRGYLQGEVLREQLDWWKARLGGLTALQLPTDRPRPRLQTFNGAEFRFHLPAELGPELRSLCQQENVTLSMVFLTAFLRLLHRYTNQEDIAVGMPIANRTRSELEDLLGVFINMLVLRTDLGGDPSFRELLRRVRDEMLGAFAHQDVPFEKLVEELKPERDTSRSPFFQVMFNFMNEGMPRLEAGGTSWAADSFNNGTSKFDLSLVIEENADGIEGFWEYNTDLFDTKTVARMASHFQTIVRRVATDPDALLSKSLLLPDTERRRLVVRWNRTEAEYPRDRCVHQLVEEQAARTPGRVAVVLEGQQLTYAELNTRANQLAHHLRTLGVGPDVLVGLCVERSLDMVVGLLGILKAGGAYVPLDPAFPADRLAFYVEDSRMPVLVTQEKLKDRLPPHQAQVVSLDGQHDLLLEQPTHNPENTTRQDHLVYVIYTSGSTGKPKGVQLLHGAVVNFLNAMRREPGLNENDVLLAVTTLSFDIHVLEVWLPLLVGARVVIVSREVSTDGVRLLRLLEKSKATVLQATPATWRLLLAAGWERSPQLKALCGGEPMTLELAGQLLERVGELWNMYGPTETTVWSTIYRVQEVTGAIPIGRPIDNTSIYLVDKHMNLVPIGAAGELLIGGDGLARGYLNRPELTAEKFLADPFSGKPNARVYRTGDLARYRPDGLLECLGRIDHQVKIRGFRIELGEIETVLGQHPGVGSNVVVARKDDTGADCLAAYFLPRPGSTPPTAEELRRFLQAKLPDYMVPAYFVPLDAFPLTPNGKIDRKALPAPESIRAGTPRHIVPPRTDAERDLAAIWEEVLKVQPIGVTDDFFDLGGHSFLAAVLMAKIRLRLGHTLPLGTLFAAPTVEKLAAVLTQNLEIGSEGCLVPLQEEGTRPPLFLIAGIGGHVFTFHKFARLLGPEQPAYGVKAIGVDGTVTPPERIEEIATHYVREITARRPQGPYIVGGYSIGALVAYELALQMQDLGHRVESVIVFDMTAPGYPRPLPVTKRMLIHLGNFLKKSGNEKLSYLRDRLLNVKGRLFMKLGLGMYQAPEIQGVDALPQDALKRVWVALAKAQARYQPARKFDGPIILFKAEEGFQWEATVFDDPLMGWADWTTRGVEEYTIPGSHLELFSDRNIGGLASTLRGVIDRATQGKDGNGQAKS